MALSYDDNENRIPPDMLPIGSVLMKRTGLLLLNLGADNYGSIWAWDRVDETWGTGQNKFIGFVARDFDTMLAPIEMSDD